MRRLHRTLLVGWALVLLGAAAPVHGQSRPEQDPGYVDFSEVDGWFADAASVEVNIKGTLLRLVAEASRYDDPELADLLMELDMIQVRAFPLRRSQFRTVGQQADRLARRLERDGWDTVLRVRDDADYEYIDMHVRVVDDAIAGLVVLVVSPGEEETAFVNIVGEIDPAQIGRIGRKFNLSPLDRSLMGRN